MKTLCLAVSAVVLFSCAAIAQKDTLGSPTPAPDPVQTQNAPPAVPNTGGVPANSTTTAKPETSSTTGSRAVSAPKSSEKPGVRRAASPSLQAA
jgi:hypothetical protein